MANNILDEVYREEFPAVKSAVNTTTLITDAAALKPAA
jgi:hypothetical protein